MLRGTPVSSILLTNADLDHALGLLSLREGGRLRIIAPKMVRDALAAGLNLTSMLDAFCDADWIEPPEADFAPLHGSGAAPGSLDYRAVALPGGPPLFARGRISDGVHSVAYQIRDRKTGGTLLVAPDVAGWNEPLAEAIVHSDAVLFDGTFWSDDELQSVKPTAPKASQMGHVTIRDQSLARLGRIAARRKIYIHINNTNPVLSPNSPERAAVAAAGVAVGYDGLEFEL